MSRPFSSESPYRAIAHAVRRRIIQKLRAGECTAGEFMESFQMSKPNLSQHLRILKEAGLISCRRRGPYMVYRLLPAKLREPREWLASMMKS